MNPIVPLVKVEGGPSQPSTFKQLVVESLGYGLVGQAIVSGGIGIEPSWGGAGGIGSVTLAGDVSGSGSPIITVTVSSYNGGTVFGTMAGQDASAVAISGGTITGLGTPTSSSDAVNKAYVDTLTSGLTFVAPGCRVATTAALTATYSNGTLGVGATLTNADTQAAIAIDGVSLSSADRVLVKDQAAPAQNGIYTVTTVGSGATNWVLTRATNYDQLAEITSGSYTAIGAGTANVGTLWIMTGAAPITVGTTAVTFTGLTLTGSGTITSIATGTGLTGGPITSTGTISIAAGSHNVLAGYDNSGVYSEVTIGTGLDLTSGVLTVTAVSGTVTSVGTGTGLTGGPITGTGTISIANSGVDTIQIADSAITLDKLDTNTPDTLLGFDDSGNPAIVTIGTGIDLSSGTLSATGTGGTVTSITAGSGLSGGTITTSGTISIPDGAANTLTGYDNAGAFSGVSIGDGLDLASGTLVFADVTGGFLLANFTEGTAPPTAGSLSDLIDAIMGNTQGDILYRSATGWQALGAGNADQVLTAHGAASDPTWEDSGGGGGSGSRTFPMQTGFNSDVIVASDVTGLVLFNKGGTFARWDMGCKPTFGPVGADLIIDFLLSSDNGSTWQSIWHTTPSDRPTIADGDIVGTGTSFDVTTFSAGDWGRWDIIQVGSTTAGQWLSATILGTLS